MRPAAELVRQQLLSKARLALLVPEEAIRYRSGRRHAKGFTKCGKIDIAGVILPLNDPLAAQIEGRQGKASDFGLAGDAAHHGHENRSMQGIQDALYR